MGLSNESQPSTQTAEEYIGELAQMSAKRLASQMIQYTHNPDPREAVSPAHGVHIRKLVPIRPRVADDVKDHNSAVSNLGADRWRQSR